MTTPAHPSEFVVRAPASTANLGAGFDCAAVALELWNELHVTAGNGSITIDGTGADALPADESNLVIRCLERVAPGAFATRSFHCTNAVPVGKGLGSSTAAAALGLIAGWTITGHAWTHDELFNELTDLDGHPDNAAAVAYGGTLWCTQDTTIHFGAGAWLHPVALVPDRMLATTAARAALPRQYARDVVARQIAAAGTLAVALATQRPELLASCLHEDHVHEQARAHLVPELQAARDAIHPRSDALGATISGAGPTVMVWGALPDADIGAYLQERFPEHTVLTLRVAAAGASVR